MVREERKRGQDASFRKSSCEKTSWMHPCPLPHPNPTDKRLGGMRGKRSSYLRASLSPILPSHISCVYTRNGMVRMRRVDGRAHGKGSFKEREPSPGRAHLTRILPYTSFSTPTTMKRLMVVGVRKETEWLTAEQLLFLGLKPRTRSCPRLSIPILRSPQAASERCLACGSSRSYSLRVARDVVFLEDTSPGYS